MYGALIFLIILSAYDRIVFEKRITNITNDYSNKLEQTNHEVIRSFNQINDRLTSIEGKIGKDYN